MIYPRLNPLLLATSAAALLAAGAANAQDAAEGQSCEAQLTQIESAMMTAELNAEQQEQADMLLQEAQTAAQEGNEEVCLQVVAQLRETVPDAQASEATATAGAGVETEAAGEEQIAAPGDDATGEAGQTTLQGDEALTADATASGGQIIVEQPAPEIMVNETAPRVQVQQQQAEVRVHQPAPEIMVTMPPPEVTVTVPPSIVTVEQTPPEIQIEQAQPRVMVQETQPEVQIREEDAQVQVTETQPEVQILESEDAPRVQFSQDEPTVTVEQADPIVTVEQADPQVSFQETTTAEAGEADPALQDQQLADSAETDPALQDQQLADSAETDPVLQDQQVADSAETDPALQDQQLAGATDTDPTATDEQLAQTTDPAQQQGEAATSEMAAAAEDFEWDATIGQELTTDQGETVGTIELVVVGREDDEVYVIVATDPELDAGAQFVAVPREALRMGENNELMTVLTTAEIQEWPEYQADEFLQYSAN